MEANELRVFVKVVQCGSFTRAADLLKTQKTYVSRVISQLEKKLQVRLLERSTRSLSLTEIGREMFERAVSILDAMEETQKMVQKSLGEPQGMLKLTCSVDFGLIAVGDWINSYLHRYTHVTIDADYSGRTIDMVHEGFDLAIRVGHLKDSNLVARKLGDIDYGIYASPDYFKQRTRPEKPEELAEHALIYFSGGANKNEWIFHKLGAEYTHKVSPRLSVNNSFALRDAAIKRLGIAKIPKRIAEKCVTTGELVALLGDWQIQPISVFALFPSTRYLTPKVRTFIDHAVDNFD
jgi:LysR family transcriptional regulator, regulator for bpeEF and oprC